MIRFRQLLTAVAVWLSLFLGTGILAHAAVDTSVTQRVWKLKFGVTDAQMYNGGNSANGLNMTWLNADADGDGIKNIDEITTGTSPFNPGKTIAITSVVRNGSNVELQFPTENGKLYRVEFTTTLANAGSWALHASPTPGQWIGNGSTLMFSLPYAANTFYRVRVDELDSDGDGVSDWVESETSLNPNSMTTVAGVNDHDYVTGQLALPSVVSIHATKSFASEDGPDAGTFTVSRTQKLLPITVNLTHSGTAVAGSDYSALPSSVTFTSGIDSVPVPVNPVPDSVVEGSKSVTASLQAPGGSGQPPFTLSANASATVIINDSTVPTGTGLLARYYDTAGGIYADAVNFGQSGTFTYTRVGASAPFTGSTIVIPFTYNGSPALQVGHLVKLTFTSGSLNSTTFNHQNYTVTAVNPGVNFTVGISGATLPTSYSPTGSFSIQSFPHPAIIERVDPVVDFDWAYGTPNDVGLTPNNPVDNYSTVFEGYLHPTTAGNYQFQLDADDKARVLVDLNLNGTFDLPGEEILEHGWDGATTPETVGTFKASAVIPLVIPGTPAQRYKIRVEHVETTGDARCRLQWREGANGYANIPQANVFSHTRALTNYTVSSSVATINTAVAHGLTANVSTVTLYFTSGSLFTPPANYSGTYTVASVVDADTFTISVPGAANQASAAAGFMADTTSTATGWLSRVFTNTSFTAPAGYVGVLGAGATNANNGLWGSGTPDPVLIGKDTFSIRWTGQVQPQFSEDYTFVVFADDGTSLRINGQVQEMETVPSTSIGNGTYDYSSTNGDTVVTYTNVVVKPGSYIVGETVRVDPTSANLTHGTGSTYTFDGVTGYLTVNYSNLTNITPGGFTPGETIELDPTGGTLTTLPNLPYVIFDEPSNSTFRVFVGTGLYDSQTTAPEATINIADTRNAVVTKVAATGATYSGYNSSTGVATITYSSITGIAPGSFTNGMTVELDPTSNALAPLTNGSYVVSGATATTFNVTFPTAMAGTNSGSINIASSSNGVIPASITTAFTINFGTGKYSTGTGNINVEIVDKPLKEWSSMGNERYVRIPMIGGVRYDIQLDFWESGGYSRCKLYWFSPSQPKQIIPAERLYPSSVPQAPTAHISSTDATALVNGAFSVPIAGSNGGSVSLSGNPAWLTYANGVLSGTPPAGTAGDYQVTITITNANGTSTSVVNIHVEDTGGTIVREYWNGVSGSSVASIPTSTTPSGTSNLGSLEAPTDFGDDYGTRIRGYITAPETGNYYFWIAASSAAELWISNDDEPINAFKRAWVNTGSATPQTWSAEANQKSPWLALEQGKKYYVEILHKAGTGSGDNLAVGWAKPGQPTNTPNQVVPGYALSTYTPPAPGSTPGTLYLATMLSQSGAATSGVGSSTLRLSDDGASAIMKYSYSGLTGPITSQHIHTDPYLTHPSTIVFDIDTPETPGDGLQPDGSYKWTITPIGTLSAADIVEIIKQGKAYINLHTAAYPAGEIRGNYTLANGSRTFTTPPAPPSWTDDHTDAAAAARFLTQATFGPRISDITTLQGMASYDAWIEDQFTKSTSLHLPEVIRTENASAQGGAFATALTFNAWWWRSITGDDQLRQRIAFALSEIHVVSGQGPLENNALALSYFYDKLATNAFGNFRDILEDTTLTPSMGRYLDMLRNDKPDQTVGRIPNENYAREIKQLFSVGLYRMWPDGTLMLTSKDAPIDTYTQREIIGFAHVFTGWDYGYDGALHSSFSSTTNWTRQMRETPARHYTGPKRILNNEVLPGIPSLGGQPLDPLATHTSNDYNDPAYTVLPGLELDLSHDQLFNHPNTGPFICRQLIQRLVTSHPSRDYLYRVVQKFNDNGSGVRGDMQAVIKAILLDYEARSPDQITKPAFGKQREPVMRVAAAARAFRTDTWAGTYSQSASPSSTSRNITVTTTTPHKLVGGNNVLLDFTSGSPAPWIGSYQVLSSPAPTTNSFTVTAQGWATGTYSIPANSTTCTVTMSSHWLQVGHQVYIDFTSGTADGDAGLDNVVYTLATASAETGAGNFTFTIAGGEVSASARSGNMMLPRFSPGSFTTAASGLPAPQDRRVTMDTNVDHHLNVGDQVQLNFYGGFPQPTDMVVTVESVVDLNTWTFLASGTGTGLSPNQGYDQVFQFPLVSQPLTRSGNVGSRPSTYAVGETTSTIDQSPLNSPTVFNFFLPDFKYPGALASQGITTPEFQTTAETTVIRQANYLYNGIFNPANTNGISSFNTGNNALVMDLSPWMTNTTTTDLGLGAPTNAAKPWTNNENISVLIDQLNILLVAGQLSPQAKTIIRNFVAQPITSISTHASACTVTTSGNHSLNTGDIVVISGVNGGTFGGTANALNSTTTTRTVTVTGPNTFTIPISCTVTPTSVAAAHVSVVPYNNATTTTTSAPSDTHKRDRLRAIIHLILTSPDFTIQR